MSDDLKLGAPGADPIVNASSSRRSSINGSRIRSEGEDESE